MIVERLDGRRKLRKTPRFLIWAIRKIMMPFTDIRNTGKSETDKRVEDDDLIFMKKWN